MSGYDGRQPLAGASRWRTFADALWGPIPWLLEAMIVLLFALGDYAGMATVAVLLGFNVVSGLVCEGCGRPPRGAS